MIWLVQDAHQRGFRSGYTECRLIKKWVYTVYLRIPSTTPLIIDIELVGVCWCSVNMTVIFHKILNPTANLSQIVCWSLSVRCELAFRCTACGQDSLFTPTMQQQTMVTSVSKRQCNLFYSLRTNTIITRTSWIPLQLLCLVQSS